MIKREFRCKKCGYRFVVEIFELGEAQARRLSSSPVRCRKCQGPVEPIR